MPGETKNVPRIKALTGRLYETERGKSKIVR
jgi:hypothetical protein